MTKLVTRISTLTATLVLLVPACAGAEGYDDMHASGSAETSVETVKFKDAGTITRRTLFSQRYAGSASAPLLFPGLGSLTADASYKADNNMAQLASGSDPAEKVSQVGVTANLLSPEFQRYANVSPFFRQTTTSSAWDNNPSRRFLDTTVGGAMGIFLPALPSVNLSYTDSNRHEAGTPTSDAQKTKVLDGRMAYNSGPLRVDFHQEARRTLDGITGSRGGGDNINAEAEYSLRDIAAPGIQDFSYRTNYVGQETGVTAVTDPQRNVTGRLLMVSDQASLGPVVNYLTYGQTSSADLVKNTRKASEDATLTNFINRTSWNAGNDLRFEHNPGDSRLGHGLVERPRIGKDFFKGVARYDVNGEADWRWANTDGNRTAQSVNQRASLFPARSLDLFATQQSTVAEAVTDRKLTRSNGAGGGFDWRAFSRMSFNGAFNRTLSKTPSTGGYDQNDSISAGTRITPVQAVMVGFLYTRNTGQPFIGDRNETDTLGATLSAELFTGFRLNGNFNRVVQSVGAGSPDLTKGKWDGKAGAGYTVGRTDFMAEYETRQLSLPRSYDRMALSLRRTF